MSAQVKHIYEFGPFRLIPSERSCCAIPPGIADPNFRPVSAAGRKQRASVDKEVLLKRIWPDSYVEEANLSVNMSALRRALVKVPKTTLAAETVPRHGYRFVAEVKERGALRSPLR